MQYDSTSHHSWHLSYRGRVAVFIDGNNLFHAARFHTLDIDYNKLLQLLLGDGRLLRAFFYTGVDAGAERQQGFLLWMRRNGFRVIQKELKTFYDGTRKANLDVEIAVDMLSLAGAYDTAVLVSGDEDFVYAVNAVAYKGCRVEIAGFRSNTAPKLIDVADYFIDLGEIADRIRKDPAHTARCYERYLQEEGDATVYLPPAPEHAPAIFTTAVERLDDLTDDARPGDNNGFHIVTEYIRITDD
ncbi:MAG: NYN domain-containing protein [Pyrinomonadaceae bacterium MAG19_C2-C3]|nr:NYN domain-containing protein [Pyrinomonadaceae bacterium MAG19_C2-C3]